MLSKTNAELVLCFLTVNCMNSANVTVQNGNLVMTKTGATTNFTLPRIGTWTITATFNGLTQVRSVTMSGGQSQTVTYPSDIYLYNQGSYAEGFVHGWSAGEEANQVYIKTLGPDIQTTSTGAVDLTGISQVEVSWQYNIGCVNQSEVYMDGYVFVADVNGNPIRDIAWNRVYTWGNRYQNTTRVSVADINQLAKFALRLSGRGERQGHGWIYSVRVIK